MVERPAADDKDSTVTAFRAAARAGGDPARHVPIRAPYAVSTNAGETLAPAFAENVHLELPFAGLPGGTNLAATGHAN